MEQFYRMLKEYNIEFLKKNYDVPEWFLEFTEDPPPLYWRTIYKILKDEDKAKPIIEVGAGYGDVTALLYFLEFKNILSFELNRPLIEKINQKILALCGKRPTVINRKYPVKTDHTPGIIIQVNCIYSSSFKTKLDYLEGIRRLYLLNGIPYMFLFESIDDSYREPNDTYPYYVRLNEDDIKQTFPHCKIDSYPTYVYPNNRVSKTLYKICT